MNRSVTFAEAVAVWWRIGLLSFGGPAGQIALMHRIIVDEKKWLDEARFLHALNYCMLLPGPEAQQLAAYIGWLLHGVRGGVVAGVLFILPGAVAIMALSWLYVVLGDLAVVEGLFLGLKAAVLAIVVQALLRIAKRALPGTFEKILALAGFMALFAFGLPFPVVVLGAGAIGFFTARWFPKVDPEQKLESHAVSFLDQENYANRAGTHHAALVCIVLWLGTIGGLWLLLGGENVFTQIAVFFSQMAVVTFGGAYAVLAYVAQQGVEHFQWLQPGEMLDGLGLAETTPGPLILVTQFVGFLAALRQSGLEPVMLYATLGALLTTWITFLPSFLWIFAGAPHVEKLRGNIVLAAALKAITAAVVGVIANLALWFALNLLFAESRRIDAIGLDLLLPVISSVDSVMLLLSLLAFALVFIMKARLLSVLGSSALVGIGVTLFSQI